MMLITQTMVINSSSGRRSDRVRRVPADGFLNDDGRSEALKEQTADLQSMSNRSNVVVTRQNNQMMNQISKAIFIENSTQIGTRIIALQVFDVQ